MQYAMQVFETEKNDEFRVLNRNGTSWFFLTDVARMLGISDPNSSVENLDADEVDTLFPGELIVSESGLYALTFHSQTPDAKRFRKWITSEVLPALRKTGFYGGKTPAFISRYNANWDRVTPGYFSVISELVVRLWGRLEMVGHTMRDVAPDGKQIRPDTSVGKTFSNWLKKHHPELAGNFTMYIHVTDEWKGPARQYPLGMLPLFIQFVDQVWVPEHSERYFNERDPAALPYLPRLLAPAPSQLRAS